MSLWLLAIASEAAALTAAVLLASRLPDYLPIVLALCAGLVADLLVGHRDVCGLSFLLAQGASPALYHASTALTTSWPTALAWASWTVATGRWGWPTTACLPAWVGANVALVVLGPDAAGTQRALLALEGAALLTMVGAAGIAWHRRWRAPHRALLWLFAVELVVVALGPYRSSIYTRWELARLAYAAGFGLLTLLQLRQWWRSS